METELHFGCLGLVLLKFRAFSIKPIIPSYLHLYAVLLHCASLKITVTQEKREWPVFQCSSVHDYRWYFSQNSVQCPSPWQCGVHTEKMH